MNKESHNGLNKMLKIQSLRNSEYYSSQEIQDKLYHLSGNNTTFKNLMPLICDGNNILLAYRNIKNNKGSKTAGVDNKTINDIQSLNTDELLKYIRNSLSNYNPMPIRRVEIPKPFSDKTRPLGIPTIRDRIIQQAIKQVLEPICEAKFHKHSYGFRPNRSTFEAKARAETLINKGKLHFVIDIDIKSFFDEVNHAKLLKQLWSMGIRDKNLLKIISKMLKAEVFGIGKSNKGTPQGGIISPLLSNIVLNELDWWVSNQWESLKTRHKYTALNKYTALKTTKLKECFIVRYARIL